MIEVTRRPVPGGLPASLRVVVKAWRGLGPRHAAAALAIALLNAVFGINFVLDSRHLWPYLPSHGVSASLHALALVLAVTAADGLVEHGAARLTTYATAVAVAAIASSVIGWHLMLALGWRNWFDPSEPMAVQRTQMLFQSINAMIQGGLGTAAYLHWRDTQAATRLLRVSELQRTLQARRLKETRLLALQARVDPEFLFAALKQVGVLQGSDAAAADALLHEVIVLLRALMPSDDDAASTVAGECALAVSYLRVVASAIRALTIELTISAEAGEARLAPMLLLPLLKAALAAHAATMPRLRLHADTEQGRLRIALSAPANGPDAGMAFRSESTELATLRERLAQLHAADAELRIGPGPGLAATLYLPLEHDNRTDR